MASRGKKAALVGAACALAVLAVATTCWKDLVAQVHLLRIRKDPEYLYAIADRPEGSPEARAIALHLEVRSFRDAFFRECVELLLREPLEDRQAKRLLMVAVGVPTQAPNPTSGRTTAISSPQQARVVVTGTGQSLYIPDRDLDGASGVGGRRWLVPSNAEYAGYAGDVSPGGLSFVTKTGLPTERLIALGRILARLSGREHRDEAFPRFRFRVVSWEALAASTPYEVDDARSPSGATLLVAERDPEDAARLLLRTVNHMNSSVRAWAARTIGALGARCTLGTQAAAVAQALDEALRDPLPEVRVAAQEAIGKVRGGRS